MPPQAPQCEAQHELIENQPTCSGLAITVRGVPCAARRSPETLGLGLWDGDEVARCHARAADLDEYVSGRAAAALTGASGTAYSPCEGGGCGQTSFAAGAGTGADKQPETSLPAAASLRSREARTPWLPG